MILRHVLNGVAKRTQHFHHFQRNMSMFICPRPLASKVKVKVKSLYEPEGPLRPALNSGFHSMKRLGVFMLPPGWDASPSQGYPQHYAGSHLYTWVERGSVRVKRLAQERNTMSPARPRTRTTRFPESSALTMRPPRLPSEQEVDLTRMP